MSNHANLEKSNSKKMILTGAAIGALITIGLYSTLAIFSAEPDSMATTSEEKKPLYWVAPMDANYRKDKPGQSPMGMDLVPVYADGGAGSDSGPGTIKISPEVVNNLGVRTAIAEYKSLHSQIKTVGYVILCFTVLPFG